MPAGQRVDELLPDTKVSYTAIDERVILLLSLAVDQGSKSIAGILPP